MALFLALSVLAVIVSGVPDSSEATPQKILFISPLGTKSHLSFFGEMAYTLADRGYQITYVTSYPLRDHPNITMVDVGLKFDVVVDNAFESNSVMFLLNMMYKMKKFCADALEHKSVQALNFEEYSLVFLSMFGHECFYSSLESAKVPCVHQSPNTLGGVAHDLAGNIDFPSVVPNHMVTFSHPMTFRERTLNTVASVVFDILMNWYLLPSSERHCKERGLCREDWSLLESANKVELTFINSVKNLERPVRPHVPGVIHAGGLNCRPAQPLPEELDAWMREAGDAGVIYFSLGSAVKPSHMKEKHRRALVKVFESLPQRILWKWDQEQIEDMPPNVRIGKWLPQQDILGHPSVRLFITHGGLFSTWETTYHAVPALFLPVFMDQHTNTAQMVNIGVGETILWDDLTEETLRTSLQKLLNDPKYKQAVTKESVIMRDQPLSPKETVIYWTEYAIRHKGAPHLHSPLKDLAWYQVYNLDVWLCLLGVAVGATLLTVKMLLWCCRLRKTAKSLDTKKIQ